VSASDEPVVGLAGRIVTATRGPVGLGEVELHIRGGTEVFLAQSVEPLARGQAVLVVAAIDPRTVLVEPWAEPIGTTGTY
jgi:hypothetical protein